MWQALIILLVGLSTYGSVSWQQETKKIHGKLEAVRHPLAAVPFSHEQVANLPEPVKKYFQTVLTEGQLPIETARINHSGSFNTSETDEAWKPFKSRQLVFTSRPGFDWDARVTMLPGIKVRIHDAYIAGRGKLDASLFGLISVAQLEGPGEIAAGELLRWLAEAAWYPTALLPGEGIEWSAVDSSSALVKLSDGNLMVELLFRFSEDNLLESFHSEGRGRMIGDKMIKTPWEGRFSSYKTMDGLLIPTLGEVGWIYPDGYRAYWCGQIDDINYTLARKYF